MARGLYVWVLEGVRCVGSILSHNTTNDSAHDLQAGRDPAVAAVGCRDDTPPR